MVLRGDKLTAAVIYILDKDRVLILSEKGSIYSQRKISRTQFVLGIADILKKLKIKGLIRVED